MAFGAEIGVGFEVAGVPGEHFAGVGHQGDVGPVDMLRLSSCSGMSGQVLESPNFSLASAAFCIGKAVDDGTHDRARSKESVPSRA